jgi:hypothetical protein
MQQDRDFTSADKESINPCNAISISSAMDFVKNPVKCCERVQELIQKLMAIVKAKKDDPKTKGEELVLYLVSQSDFFVFFFQMPFCITGKRGSLWVVDGEK